MFLFSHAERLFEVAEAIASSLDVDHVRVVKESVENGGSEHYEKQVDAQVDALASVIEPVLILILGLVVGGILISMYLPLFSLMDVVR